MEKAFAPMFINPFMMWSCGAIHLWRAKNARATLLANSPKEASR